MWKYDYEVPAQKQIRLIIHTDCANEADDQYAVAHQLMTPKFDVRGIIAGHFDAVTKFTSTYQPATTAKASYEEVQKILKLMGVEKEYAIYKGSEVALEDETTPIVTEAAKFIIEEAMREDTRPLFIGCQGAITDLACAILMKPEICEKMTAIWVGGGDFPEGGDEFNLMQDIFAANVVYASKMPLWQIPKAVYKTLSVSLAELQYKVKPQGEIGAYLFSNMAALNMKYQDIHPWPHGEIWGLGDQSILAVLMEEAERTDGYQEIEAPRVSYTDMKYTTNTGYRKIRVYNRIDYRLTLEDLFAKLAINYGNK